MDKNKKTPLIQMNGFKDAIFTVGGKTTKRSISDLSKLADTIQSHLENCRFMAHELDRYKENYLETIDDILENQKKDFTEEDKEYSLGNNFAFYIDGAKSNDDAVRVIKADIEKEMPGNSLTFDPEYSFCYVYTENRDEAKAFLVYVYEKYIAPKLEPWREGFSEFTKKNEKIKKNQNGK